MSEVPGLYRCPTLAELPPPPVGRTGWPWTQESRTLPARRSDGTPWPRITVVTPSYNQGRYLEAAIRSVLLQGYPNLEYLVMDGGSSDQSVAIIERYAPWLHHWQSGRDGGQSAAINRGIALGSGHLATWINSDDLLCHNALAEQAPDLGLAEDRLLVGDCLYADALGNVLRRHRGRVHDLGDLLRIDRVWRRRGHIVQPEVLFPRELFLQVGGLDAANHYSMDYELWGRMLLQGARLHYTGILFAVSRQHAGQKTRDGFRTTDSLLTSAERLTRAAQQLSCRRRAEILLALGRYRRQYWRNSGWLARLGLGPAVVLPLRELRAGLVRTLRRVHPERPGGG
jgi:glycosyltransferase involved in cell wall biosynthesis